MANLTMVARPDCKNHGLPDLAPTATMVTEAAQTWTCPVDGRVWTSVIQYGTGAQCNTFWQSSAAPGGLSPMAQKVAALTVTVERALPVVAAIAVGGKLDVAVTWQSPFADSAYRVETVLPGSLVGKATVAVKAGSQSAAGVTITVTATQIVVAGSTLDVTATRYG